VISYAIVLVVHILGACVWVGGHLVLSVSVLPRALRERRAKIILDYEHAFERIGIPALLAQVITGFWLARLRVGPVSGWFADTPLAHLFHVKLALLLGTIALALHARLVLIPRLTDETLPPLAWHIVTVTTLAVLFVVAGAMFRFGGIG